MPYSVFLGTRELLNEFEVALEIKTSKNYENEIADGETPSALLIFDTSKQRSWLVSTSKRLYNILDDVRKEAPHVNWSIPRQAIVVDDELKLNVSFEKTSANSGVVLIGPEHKSRKFSTKLFNNLSIDKSIESLVSSTMI